LSGGQLIDVVLLTLLASTAIAIARLRNLLATAMLTGIFSLLGACWMLFLDAPDVAFTEAAVGAGMSTILILATLCVVTDAEKPSRESPLALVAVLLTGGALVYGTLDMPRYGDREAPATTNPITGIYLDSARTPVEHEEGRAAGGDPGDRFAVGIPNTVTAVLASFRSYDTMGETAVIFTAGLGVLMVLAGARHRRPAPDPGATIDPEPVDEGPGA
jgi:multicomponent Na+:H+ antiporter subunit B